MHHSQSGSNQVASFEYLRVISAFGIVWFHMGDVWGKKVAYAGLFSFTMLTVYLACGSVKRRGFSEYARERFRRLMVPWFFWSVFYITLRLALSAQLPVRSAGEAFDLSMILGGGHTVLWYLSFMYLVSLAIYGIGVIGRGLSSLSRSVIFLLATVTFILLRSAMPGGLSTSYPFSQWMAVTPAVLFGLASASASEIESGVGRRYVFGGMFLLSVAGMALCLWSGSDLGGFSLGLGAFAFLLCLVIQLPEAPKVKVASGLTLGIYVLHPCVSKLLEVLHWRMPFPLDVVVVFCLSALGVLVLQKSQWMRRFV